MGANIPQGDGLLTNSQRGVWSLTDHGSALLEDRALDDVTRQARITELRGQYLEQFRGARKARSTARTATTSADQPVEEEDAWKQRLLGVLMGMEPDAFERLAKRLLREADFDSVNVTGRSGDGGIDGVG